MKIESLHIENFGKLHDVTLDFNQGLNVFKEENGWGKSTLSSFLCVMFYGFDGEGKRDAIANERQRFTPWQGGTYGGSLVFESKGERFEITRTFGVKAHEDTFECRNADTNLISDRFSPEIGKELFHINRESFCKTVLIRQNDCASSDTTDDINSRIGNISDTMDLNRFKKADDLLADTLNKWGKRKTGRLGRLSEEITSLSVKIREGQNLEPLCENCRELIRKDQEELIACSRLEKEQKEEKEKLLRQEGELHSKAEYEKLLAELSEKKAACQQETAWFPGDVPTMDRLKEWEGLNEQQNRILAKLESTALTEEEKKELTHLSEVFKRGLPEEATIAKYEEEDKELILARREEEKYSFSGDEEELLSLFRTTFQGMEDPENRITQKKREWFAFLEKRKKETENEAALRDIREKLGKARTRSNLFLILFLIFGIWFLAGGFLLKTGPLYERFCAGYPDDLVMTVFVLLEAVGGLILFTALILRIFSSDIRNLKARKEALELENGKLSEEGEELKASVADFLASKGFSFTEETCENSLDTLYKNALEWRNLEKKYAAHREHSLSPEMAENAERIREFLGFYGFDAEEAEFDRCLTELRYKTGRYRTLVERKAETEKQNLMAARLSDDLKKGMETYAFETKEGSGDLLPAIHSHLLSYSKAHTLLVDAVSRVREFEDSHDTKAFEELTEEKRKAALERLGEEEESLRKQKEEITQRKSLDEQNRDSMLEKYEEWTENRERLENLKKEQEEAQRFLSITEQTKLYLNEAKENMTTRYTGPLKEGFDRYFKILTGESGEDYRLDANLVLTRTEAGSQRDRQSLSFGYQDLCGFCMRLALTDAMYKGEKPVLIMDDPFVNLDDEKIRGAKELVRQVAGHYQILYMTCREDRL